MSITHLNKDRRLLKKGVWLFFFLLIFEGALRKWFLPFLATPLLIVRDPIAIWLLYEVWRRRLLHFNPYIFVIFIVTAISFILTLWFAHGNLWVAIYGARIYIIYFPVIFAIGKIFDHEDVIKMGRVLLWISIPMLILIALQFYSPQTAWVNVGVGGEGSAGFDTHIGNYFRPPGTFSFMAGNAFFWALVAPFILYFWIVPKLVNKTLLIVASVCVLMASQFSVSRTLVFSIVLSVIFAVFYLIQNRKNMKKLIMILIPILLIFAIISLLPHFQKGQEVMAARFELANNADGGLAETLTLRILFSNILTPITNSIDMPWGGSGLGMGTNAGSAMMTGTSQFLISEGEWGRVWGEMGFLLGLIIIFLRIQIVIQMFTISFKQWHKNPLPYMLLSFAVHQIIIGQWGVPTMLGFAVLSGGLIMASLKNNTGYEKNNGITSYRQSKS
jgi:hypothetical protein